MGAIPMGQEIAVTPVQIITMVSTIANGGVYVPPHILLKSTELMKGDPKLKAAAFHPEGSLPDPLPEGAHRVISEMTAAQMRKMMQDVVLMGTAHGAVHLNGYSAAGKTGTAQKIDPPTHTDSKTNFVASFVGFAPVNNPAITIAVVMDSPSHSMHFGAQASAPVFQDLAQQILEYLGVPHDEPMQSSAQVAKAEQTAPEEAPPEQVDDLNSLFAEVNNLPADDPLRASGLGPTRLPQSRTDEPTRTPDPNLDASLKPAPPPFASQPDAPAVSLHSSADSQTSA